VADDRFRIGNFINGELWGKPTDVPWAFNVPDEVFAGFRVGDEVLHPTMLYEAALEGLVLFVILWWFSSKERPYMAVSGMFLLLYGIFRFYIEFNDEEGGNYLTCNSTCP
jgi:phosphatidylglycerol:prolipoprotein diacylglycerol transferase